jgi:hypothetical protein
MIPAELVAGSLSDALTFVAERRVFLDRMVKAAATLSTADRSRLADQAMQARHELGQLGIAESGVNQALARMHAGELTPEQAMAAPTRSFTNMALRSIPHGLGMILPTPAKLQAVWDAVRKGRPEGLKAVDTMGLRHLLDPATMVGSLAGGSVGGVGGHHLAERAKGLVATAAGQPTQVGSIPARGASSALAAFTRPPAAPRWASLAALQTPQFFQKAKFKGGNLATGVGTAAGTLALPWLREWFTPRGYRTGYPAMKRLVEASRALQPLTEAKK